LQSSSPKIFDINPDALLETTIIDIDDECVPPPKKPEKVVVDLNCKFQEIWVVKMPWVKPIFNEVGLVSIVRCHELKGKKKKLVAKWDFIEKHASNLEEGFDGKWIMDPKCMHVKHEISYVQLFINTIFQQLNNGQAMEDNHKLVQLF